MKKSMCCLLMIVTVCLLSGCGVAYRQNHDAIMQTSKAEDFGVLPEDYKEKIKEFMMMVLKDPDSAKYSNWQEPYKGTIPTDHFSPTPVLCWKVYVYINARNSFGGYTGGSMYGFAFVNGKIVAFGEKDKVMNYIR